MYIIAIGWLWVALMMAITEANAVAGILSFVFYGLLPCMLLIWLLGTSTRRQRHKRNAELTIEPVQTQTSDNNAEK